MVLQLSTSPFTSRASAPKLPASSSAPDVSSVKAASASSPMTRFSFMADKAMGVWARTAVRFAGVASGLFTILIVPTIKVEGLNNGFGRGTQYLTIMSVLLSMICLSLGVAGDMLRIPSLTRLKNAMLPVLVPVECAVGVYWYLTLSNVYHIYPDGNR
ncbi:MAG: hypothetical protein J3Q66DRAFT_436773 [Benniella sp.]|nr:MAG: hypothetical protein J3Q66DRAFT_436773 [Benniella sp.]